ncbi:hypothetical protein [Streptosporangium sp. NPDC002524]|uniref:hypothetical protein n=1 Tax=Streptosporangium sp. NPDC002524 TaxID=3154537 RepID=UPI00332F5425
MGGGMAEQEQPVGLAVQIAEVRRILEVGLTDLRGQLALVLQRAEHGERRHEELVKVVADMRGTFNERLDELEKRVQGGELERAKVAGVVEWSKRKATGISLGIGAAGLVLGFVMKLLGVGA